MSQELKLKVPSNWKIVTLEHLCGKGAYGSGASAINFDEQKPRYIRITDINEHGNLNDSKVSPSTGPDDWGKNACEDGDLLFARSGATVGKTFLYDSSYGPSVYAGYLIRFRPDKKLVSPRYLYHFTKTKAYHSWVSAQQKIVAQPNINASQYGNELPIPLPPLAEQQRIAAILDQADALRTKRRAALAKLDTLLQATFLHMFGENDYEYPTIEDLLKDKVILVHKDGNHGSNYPKSHDFEEQGIPFLSAKCIDESGNIESQLIENLNKNKASQLKIGWIERGDVLLAHNASVGKVALYDGRFPRALIGTSLTAFRPDPNRLLPEYLFAALRSPSFQRQLEKNMGQTTRNQVPITAQRRLSIPLPPKSEQAKFAKIAQLIGQQRRKLEDAINACNVLFHSLQQRAFKGEL